MQRMNRLPSIGTLPSFSQRALFALLCTAVGVVACTGTIMPGGSDEAAYHISSSRPSAQVTANNEEDSAIVDIYSDNGIGSATVTLVSGAWPETINMRFHLQGLEDLQFVYGETIVKLSVNTQNMILQTVSIAGAAEEAVDEQSDYWMPVAFEDKTGKAIDSPAAGGVIEVTAPADFLAGDHAEFTINWIDFYR